MSWGYLEYCGDIMNTLGVFSTMGENLLLFEYPMVQHSNYKGWYSPTILNTPMVFKIAPMYLMIFLSVPHCTQDNSMVLMISPQGTEHLLRYSRYPHGTEHPHGTQHIPNSTQDIPHMHHDVTHGTEHPSPPPPPPPPPNSTTHMLYRVNCFLYKGAISRNSLKSFLNQ